MQSTSQQQSVKVGEDGCRYRTVFEETCRDAKCAISESVFRRCPHDRQESLMSSTRREQQQAPSSSSFGLFADGDDVDDLLAAFSPFLQRQQRPPQQRDPYIEKHGQDM